MIYTHNMLEKIKRNYNFIIVGLGILLICAGFMGNIITFVNSHAPTINGAFRYVEKINGTETTADSIEPVVLNKKESIYKKNSIETISYILHPNVNKTLEVPLIPDKIEIPAIKLVAPVLIAEFNFTDVDGETFGQWIPPSEFAAAWHPDSGLLGQIGNTVINGHHNAYGEVFGKLVELKSGDFIYVYAKGKKYTFVVANIMILEEKGQSAEVRQENAKWLGESDDVRLTLVTCWPKKTNTHRLIIVARPY